MTDRINGFTVILQYDIRDDDAQATINAIRQIKGVADVVPNVVTPADHIAVMQTKVEIAKKLEGFTRLLLE